MILEIAASIKQIDAFLRRVPIFNRTGLNTPAKERISCR